jgi:hypothetical protein
VTKTLRVFISSPGDVRPERLITEKVVQRLGREFAYHFPIEPVMWEREPLVASQHFQEGITPPRETDIVVVILWSRLGVPFATNDEPVPDTARTGRANAIISLSRWFKKSVRSLGSAS